MNRNDLEILAHAEAIAFYPAVTYSMEIFANAVNPGMTREQIKDFYKCPPLYGGLERCFTRDTATSTNLINITHAAADEIIREIDTILEAVHSKAFDSVGSGCKTTYRTDEHRLELIEHKDKINRWLEYLEAASRLLNEIEMLKDPEPDYSQIYAEIEAEIKNGSYAQK